MLFTLQKCTKWITSTLKTLASNHSGSRQISLRASGILFCPDLENADPTNLRDSVGEVTYREYLELDRLLTRIWESDSTQLKIQYNVPPWVDGQSGRSYMEYLFPGVTASGVEMLERIVQW